MLHFYRFNEDVPAPVPARQSYGFGPKGKGSPDECPPLRAASAFGWDVLAAFDMTFRRDGEAWTIDNPVELETDWEYTPPGIEDEGIDGVPLTQRNAWFWEEKQTLPHVIDPHVYPQIRNQVKVSTFLFLKTDANELLYMTDVPNSRRPFRTLTALIDTDWYPASYPWHCVLELDPSEREISIEAGTPICRLFTVRRELYFAREMAPEEFSSFFNRTQEWLLRHGKEQRDGMVDITGKYVRQQHLSGFSVII